MRVMALCDHPTSGTVEVLRERLGRTDVREPRRRIGYSSTALADQLRPDLSAHDVARTPALPLWNRGGIATTQRTALTKSGGIVAGGPIGNVLDSESISHCFDTPLRLERRDDGRYLAWGR